VAPPSTVANLSALASGSLAKIQVNPKATDPGFVKQSDILAICAYFDLQTETLYHKIAEYLILGEVIWMFYSLSSPAENFTSSRRLGFLASCPHPLLACIHYFYTSFDYSNSTLECD
jgi:hypothetical protein